MRLEFKSFTLPPYGQQKKVNTPHTHSSSSSSQYTPSNDGGHLKDGRRHHRKCPPGYTIPPTRHLPTSAVCHRRVRPPDYRARRARPRQRRPGLGVLRRLGFSGRRARGWRAITRQHVARPVWPMATHKDKLTARRLVITFVPTTGWKLEDSRRAGAVTQVPSESSHRTRSIAGSANPCR